LYSLMPSIYLFFSCLFFISTLPPPRSTLFPTRRSSDLRRSICRSRSTTVTTSIRISSTPSRRLTLLPPAASPCRLVRRSRTASRSEEHTSELQSLTNLVCRLLLEKKKNNSYPIPH